MGTVELIRTIAEAFAELFKFLSTPAGQDLVRASLADRVKFEQAVDVLGQRLVAGWGEFVKLLEPGKGQ